MDEIEELRNLMVEQGCSTHHIQSRCAWAARQPKGTARLIVENVRVIKEYFDGKD